MCVMAQGLSENGEVNEKPPFDAANPYATPNTPTAFPPVGTINPFDDASRYEERMRNKIKIPAILLMVSGGISVTIVCFSFLAVSTMLTIQLFFEKRPATPPPAGLLAMMIGGVVVFAIGFFALSLIPLLAGRTILKARQHRLAMILVIVSIPAGLVTLGIFAIFTSLPASIYALVVLCDPQVRYYFDSRRNQAT